MKFNNIKIAPYFFSIHIITNIDVICAIIRIYFLENIIDMLYEIDTTKYLQ